MTIARFNRLKNRLARWLVSDTIDAAVSVSDTRTSRVTADAIAQMKQELLNKMAGVIRTVIDAADRLDKQSALDIKSDIKTDILTTLAEIYKETDARVSDTHAGTSSQEKR